MNVNIRPRLSTETANEAATLLRTTRRAIYVMADRGLLPGLTRIGRRLLFRTDPLLHWLDPKTAPSPIHLRCQSKFDLTLGKSWRRLRLDAGFLSDEHIPPPKMQSQQMVELPRTCGLRRLTAVGQTVGCIRRASKHMQNPF
jgi:hypothetical protein